MPVATGVCRYEDQLRESSRLSPEAEGHHRDVLAEVVHGVVDPDVAAPRTT